MGYKPATPSQNGLNICDSWEVSEAANYESVSLAGPLCTQF
jgi:hypothetical protein